MALGKKRKVASHTRGWASRPQAATTPAAESGPAGYHICRMRGTGGRQTARWQPLTRSVCPAWHFEIFLVSCKYLEEIVHKIPGFQLLVKMRRSRNSGPSLPGPGRLAEEHQPFIRGTCCPCPLCHCPPGPFPGPSGPWLR